MRGDGVGRPAAAPRRALPAPLPCAFGPRQVLYTRWGARSPRRARVRLQLRYDAATSTLALPFMLAVDVVFHRLKLVTRSRPLAVEELRGWSHAIDRRVRAFASPEPRTAATRRCRLTPVPPEGGPLPKYGRLADAAGAPLPRAKAPQCPQPKPGPALAAPTGASYKVTNVGDLPSSSVHGHHQDAPKGIPDS